MNSPWKRLWKSNIRSVDALCQFLDCSLSDLPFLLQTPSFPINLPLRLAKKVREWNENDPIVRQFLPLKAEAKKTGLCDPLQEQACFFIAPKLLQKYPKRALLLCNQTCAMHCRYCFRQHLPSLDDTANFTKEMEVIEQDKSIEEVILSGGDPLALSNTMLKTVLVRLDAFAHIRRIRFHSRFPIGIPERIDKPFLQILRSLSTQLFFVIHINHPQEGGEDLYKALSLLQKEGIPLLSQTVLLRKVNDNVPTLTTLFSSLINRGIIPYYLFHLDATRGTLHFQVKESTGKKLMKAIEKALPGYAVPKYAKEIPGYSSKTLI